MVVSLIATVYATFQLITSEDEIVIAENMNIETNENKSPKDVESKPIVTESKEPAFIGEPSVIETEPVELQSTFDKMTSIMKTQIEDVAEYNLALINYKYLEKGYKIDSSTMDYIANLIISGYNGIDVIDAAYFWLDTNEDISIIEDMCQWKIKNIDYDGEFWEENAFNDITDNKCGVLTAEDFEEYSKIGISIDEILIADRLSRKGVYTIQEILEKYHNGMTLTDIAIEIDQQAPWTENRNIASVYCETNSETEYPKVDDTGIFESRELAALYNAPELAHYDITDEETSLESKLDEAVETILNEIKNDLKAGNYLKTNKTEAE